jgi:hypothetical protein
VSTNTLMPAWISPSPLVKFKTVMVLPLGSGSGPSTSSRALCFRISKGHRAWACDHGSSTTSKISSESYVRICAIVLKNWVWWQKRKVRERRKSGDYCNSLSSATSQSSM